MGKSTIATFTFFSRTTCGHCKHFKGETTDKDGRSKIDPNSGWEVLTADRELQDMGVEFQLYQFGPEKDPDTGVVKNYALDEEYAKRVKGIPHLEMAVPDDPHNYVQFNDPELRGWDAKDSVPVIKKWIIRTLQQEPFKSWRPKARAARPPEAIMPNRINQPLVQAPSVHVQAPSIQQAAHVKSNFQPTPTQQALIDRHSRQPAVAQKAATISRPQHGVHHPVIQHVQVAKAEDEEEINSLQEEEANEDSEQEEIESHEEKSEQEDDHSQHEAIAKEVIAQPRAMPVQAARAPPMRRQPPAKMAQRMVKTSQPATTKGLATQRVQTPPHRQVVEAQAPVAVQAAAPVQVAPPPAQHKPKFLPSNWDI